MQLDGRDHDIGPSHNPITPKRKGYHVEIVDHLDTVGLRTKYRNDLNVDIGNIEEVDYVSSGEPLQNLIGAESCFDWIIASRVIERVHSKMRFLQERWVGKLLNDPACSPDMTLDSYDFALASSPRSH